MPKRKEKKIFKLPKPRWDGPEYVSSKEFLRVFFKYQIKDSNYIGIEHVGPFLDELLRESHKNNIDEKYLKNYKKDFIFFMEHKNEKFISMKNLKESLKMLEYSFLNMFRGRVNYSSKVLLQIWSHYDRLYTGYMTKEDVRAFAYDCIAVGDQKFEVDIIQALSNQILELAECDVDGKLSFAGFVGLLPNDGNLLTSFPTRERITREKFDEGFAYFDQYGSDMVGKTEAENLLKDVFQHLGLDDSENAVKKIRDAIFSTVEASEDEKVPRSLIALLLSH